MGKCVGTKANKHAPSVRDVQCVWEATTMTMAHTRQEHHNIKKTERIWHERERDGRGKETVMKITSKKESERGALEIKEEGKSPSLHSGVFTSSPLWAVYMQKAF